MFQSFEDSIPVGAGKQNIGALRGAMKSASLDYFIVPHDDEYQNEYIPPHADRLAWLTGFTGSAGIAIVAESQAALFVDGRYVIQAANQVDASLFEIIQIFDQDPVAWLTKNVTSGQMVGFDPKLHSVDSARKLKEACDKLGADLVPQPSNPIDAVWQDRPKPPIHPVEIYPDAYAGKTSAEKRQEIAKDIKEKNCAAAVLTRPDSIAWLLNIRGSDVAHTPLVLSYVILNDDGHATLFVEREKVGEEVVRHLGNEVTIAAPATLEDELTALAKAKKTLLMDPASAPSYLFSIVENHEGPIRRSADPCALPKACKNSAEVEGIRKAHVRDGAALSQFLAWMSQEASKGTVDEIAAAKKLEAFRNATGKLRDLSFDTISGSGPNGAIVHYRVTENTNRQMENGELYLVDSGAQYLDGTTDVTRTIAIGKPNAEQRDRFTRVLKGHIALATARFPEGTSGAQLDALARMALWKAGLNYDHGTGHGVGCYLGVHEGPQGISSRSHNVALKAGMVLSNEPGYYKTDDFGIRIENLVVVSAAEPIDGGERPMMSFETLTLAPIDLALIDGALLTPEEKEWLNAYHARVSQTIEPLVDQDCAKWLRAATQSI